MLNGVLLLIIAGGLLPLGASYWWFFELFAHFRLQYLAVALLLLVPGVIRRRRTLSIALLAVMMLNAWPLAPYLPLARTAGTNADLTLLNLNVHSSNTAHDAILGAIRAADADIVTILELTPALDAALAALDAEYPYRMTEPSTGNFGLGVLSRHPLRDPERFELGPSPALEAVVEAPDGPFRIVAVHPVPPIGAEQAATRNRQLGVLADRLRGGDEPLIVCGDFNLSPYSPHFRRFAIDSGMADVRRGQGPGFSWPAFLPLLGIPIDHCFTRGPFDVATVERMAPVGSDHYPVRVRLIRRDDQ